MSDIEVRLPKRVEPWSRPDHPRKVTAADIFDYMNGAGELYLGYQFDRLDVYVYGADARPDILVEMYRMKTTEDAFGLLSLDWGGEAVELAGGNDGVRSGGTSDPPRALYGEGLLRLCAGPVYARIMAERETPGSREAVLALGRAAVSGQDRTPVPQLFLNLPERPAPGWSLRRDTAAYFRSHLVLNSIYFVASENLFELGLQSEAVTAVYAATTEGRATGRRLRYLGIRYPDGGRARSALKRFHEVFLPEFPRPEPVPEGQPILRAFSLEEGWLGYRAEGSTLAVLFEGPDRATVTALLEGMRPPGSKPPG